MKYTVEWTVDALNQLAQAWMAALDREAITTASHDLDEELERDPMPAVRVIG